MALFEIYIWNRVVRISDGRPIQGRQGQGHGERLLVAADYEERAMEMAFDQIWERPLLGISSTRQEKLVREIEIHGIRRRS